jgi:hypothetical protein
LFKAPIFAAVIWQLHEEIVMKKMVKGKISGWGVIIQG